MKNTTGKRGISIAAMVLVAVISLSIIMPVVADASSGNWRQSSGRWWFQQGNSYATGWERIGGTWYFFDSAGWMRTGWVFDGGAWYFLRPSGAMATGWVRDGGAWYFLRPSGAMATGWIRDGGAWYYLRPSGAMATGWVQSGGLWYWMHPSGAMATGTVMIGGRGYSFAADGRWLGNGAAAQTQQSQPSASAPSAAQLEQEVLALVNAERARHGLQALAWHEQLATVARSHSRDMATRGFFAHTCPSGIRAWDRITAMGLPVTSGGENIALSGVQSAAVVMSLWMNSPGHRANILNPDFTHLGVGVHGNHWTQKFATLT